MLDEGGGPTVLQRKGGVMSLCWQCTFVGKTVRRYLYDRATVWKPGPGARGGGYSDVSGPGCWRNPIIEGWFRRAAVCADRPAAHGAADYSSDSTHSRRPAPSIMQLLRLLNCLGRVLRLRLSSLTRTGTGTGSNSTAKRVLRGVQMLLQSKKRLHKGD